MAGPATTPLELLDMIMDAIRRGDPEAMRILAAMSIDQFGGLGSQPDASERYFALSRSCGRSSCHG